MASDVATVGLTYAASDIQNLEGLFLEITQGLGDSPTVRGVDVVVPGLAGQVARPRKFHERRIVLTGFVHGTDLADYRTKVRAMLALFDATAAPADLVATLEDGDIATIAARTLSVAFVEVVPGFADLSIELLATEDWTYTAAGS